MVIDERTERFVMRKIWLERVVNFIVKILRGSRVDKTKDEQPEISKIINRYAKVLTHTKLSRSDAVAELRSMFMEAGSVPITIARARKTMRDAFKADPDWKRTYIANISMRVFYDQMGIEDSELRDKMAEKILDLIFEE